MAKTLLMKTWLMVVVVALALVLAASVGPFAEDANALPSEGGNIAGKYPPLDSSYQLAEWNMKATPDNGIPQDDGSVLVPLTGP